ncbi:unnamed protein product [Blepharisma stoltei]|uniref:Uncharacterized protein n=1 Tax=Blepharisma stoltei TaxID=1481888 RepID=A0AAU9JEK2_9CILI|nr:unnamed protein product [Blepharisma stoltei]
MSDSLENIPEEPKYSPRSAYNINTSSPALAPDFGLKLLEKEYEVEHALTSKSICELVELYTEAIEYYDYNENPISKSLQERMHSFLSRFDVVQVMKSHASAVKKLKRRRNMRERTKTIEKLKKFCSIDLPENFTPTPNQRIDKNINRVVHQQDSRSHEFMPKVIHSISIQDQDLNERVSSRKSKLNRSIDYEDKMISPKRTRARLYSDDIVLDNVQIYKPSPFDKLLESIEECRSEERKRTGIEIEDVPIVGLEYEMEYDSEEP